MKYKLIYLDNELSRGQDCVGKISIFNFDGQYFYFDAIRSSRVVSINKDLNRMEIQTRNSKYVFEEFEYEDD